MLVQYYLLLYQPTSMDLLGSIQNLKAYLYVRHVQTATNNFSVNSHTHTLYWKDLLIIQEVRLQLLEEIVHLKFLLNPIQIFSYRCLLLLRQHREKVTMQAELPLLHGLEVNVIYCLNYVNPIKLQSINLIEYLGSSNVILTYFIR